MTKAIKNGILKKDPSQHRPTKQPTESPMWYVLGAIASYLLSNVAIWLSRGTGGLIAYAGANVLAIILTGIYFRRELKNERLKEINWVAVPLGSFGVLFIVMGLRGSHDHLPISLSVEAVYNAFACLSWPLFVLLNRWSPKAFGERPNRFDLICHMLMATMVTLRFATYGAFSFDPIGLAWIGLAVLGYMIFNVSIKLSKKHRYTNMAMNLGGAILLLLASLVEDGIPNTWNHWLLASTLLGGLAIYGIVKFLGDSYDHFGKAGKGSLVAPLVYDGILVASPVLMPITGEPVSGWTLAVAGLMLAITIARFHHHHAKK